MALNVEGHIEAQLIVAVAMAKEYLPPFVSATVLANHFAPNDQDLHEKIKTAAMDMMAAVRASSSGQ